MIVWPFGCIERQGYSVEHGRDKAQQVFAGGVFSKRTTRKPIHSFTFSHYFTRQQLVEFDTFYEDTLQGGVLPFVIEYLEDGHGQGAREVQLIGDRKPNATPEGIGYRMSFRARWRRDVELPDDAQNACATFPVPAGATAGAVFNQNSFIRADGQIAQAGENAIRFKSVIADVLPFPESDISPYTVTAASPTTNAGAPDRSTPNFATLYTYDSLCGIFLIEHGLASQNPYIANYAYSGQSDDLLVFIVFISTSGDTVAPALYSGDLAAIATAEGSVARYDNPESTVQDSGFFQFRLATQINIIPTDAEIAAIVNWMLENQNHTGCGQNPDAELASE